MIALYRCGRQAEALAVYQSARRVLVGELGIEPSPALQQVERAILVQDASLDAPPWTAPAPARAARVRASAVGGRCPPCPAAVAAAVAVGLVVVLLVAGFWLAGGEPPPASAGPDTVAVIDASRNVLAGDVTGIGRPGGIAHGAGATWITDTADNLLLRVDPAGQVVDRIPVGRGPAGVRPGEGRSGWPTSSTAPSRRSTQSPGGWWRRSAWGTARWRSHPATGRSGSRTSTDSTLSRIDPAQGRVVASIPVGSTPADVAAGDGGIWVTGAESGRLLLVDPRRNRVIRAFRSAASRSRCRSEPAASGRSIPAVPWRGSTR